MIEYVEKVAEEVTPVLSARNTWKHYVRAPKRGQSKIYQAGADNSENDCLGYNFEQLVEVPQF